MIKNKWEDELVENVKKNIIWILQKKYDNSQKIMADDLEIRSNTLHTYINSDTKPPLAFVCKLCKKHNIGLEAFVYDDLKLNEDKLKRKESIKSIYKRYKGRYYAYFFVVDSNSLKEGLIQEGILDVNDYGSVDFVILNSDKQFCGSLVAADELAFFDLKNSKEKFNITIKNSGKYIKEHYVGGMGIMNLSSPEDGRIPNAQKIIISNERIEVDNYFKTLREFLTLNTSVKIKKKLLKDFLLEKVKISMEKRSKLGELIENNKISDEDKILISSKQFKLLQSVLDKEELLLLEELMVNCSNGKEYIPYNSIKVSLEEDKMIYRFIKNEFSK